MDPGGGEPEQLAAAPVLAALTRVLERLVDRNDRVSLVEEGARGLGAFRGARTPAISVGKYLDRIHRFTGCSPSCFVLAFAYIDRAAHRHPASPLVSGNVHRLVLTSVLIASKFLDDLHHNNAFFARVGGVSNEELNRLELELLFLLDFGVVVSYRVFESYLLHLKKEMMWSEVNGRVDGAISSVGDGEVERLANGVQYTSSSPPPHSINE